MKWKFLTLSTVANGEFLVHHRSLQCFSKSHTSHTHYLFPCSSGKNFERVDKFMRRFEIKPEHFNLSLITTRVYALPEEIYGYHILLGESPKTEPKTLKDIIKQVVAALLVVGVMLSTNKNIYSPNSQHVLDIIAIECFLGLWCFYNTGSCFNYLLKKRGRKD